MELALIDDFVCRNQTFFDIRLHGRPWTHDRISRIPDLPNTRLSAARIQDLNRAYRNDGQNAIKTCDQVHYYGKVSYTVQGKPVEYREKTSLETDECLTRVKIRVGDVIQFATNEQPEGYGFAEVVAVMRHERSIFLVIRRLVATGATHPKFDLPRFRKFVAFEKSMVDFLSISLVGEPRFVNGVHFIDLQDGALVKNDWIFKAV